MDGEPDASTGVEQQNDGSSVNVEEAVAVEDKVAPTDEKPLEAAAEAPQQEGDAEAAAQEISRKIEVPNSKVY